MPFNPEQRLSEIHRGACFWKVAEHTFEVEDSEASGRFRALRRVSSVQLISLKRAGLLLDSTYYFRELSTTGNLTTNRQNLSLSGQVRGLPDYTIVEGDNFDQQVEYLRQNFGSQEEK